MRFCLEQAKSHIFHAQCNIGNNIFVCDVWLSPNIHDQITFSLRWVLFCIFCCLWEYCSDLSASHLPPPQFAAQRLILLRWRVSPILWWKTVNISLQCLAVTVCGGGYFINSNIKFIFPCISRWRQSSVLLFLILSPPQPLASNRESVHHQFTLLFEDFYRLDWFVNNINNYVLLFIQFLKLFSETTLHYLLRIVKLKIFATICKQLVLF